MGKALKNRYKIKRLLCVVHKKCGNHLYKLRSQWGLLPNAYSGRTMNAANMSDFEVIREGSISVKKACQRQSLLPAPPRRCTCSDNCRSGRCGCKRDPDVTQCGARCRCRGSCTYNTAADEPAIPAPRLSPWAVARWAELNRRDADIEQGFATSFRNGMLVQRGPYVPVNNSKAEGPRRVWTTEPSAAAGNASRFSTLSPPPQSPLMHPHELHNDFLDEPEDGEVSEKEPGWRGYAMATPPRTMEDEFKTLTERPKAAEIAGGRMLRQR